MPIDRAAIEHSSAALSALARQYELEGEQTRADELFQTAAELELASPELQACWGGPFNGQTGREAIMQNLLELLEPTAVIETGTFRGISTEWIAKHYSGPIFSCEKE